MKYKTCFLRMQPGTSLLLFSLLLFSFFPANVQAQVRVKTIHIFKLGTFVGAEFEIKTQYPILIMIGQQYQIQWTKVFLPHATLRLLSSGRLLLESSKAHPDMDIEYDQSNRISCVNKLPIKYNLNRTVHKIGSLPFQFFQDGKMKRIGNVKLNYNLNNQLTNLGSIFLKYRIEGRIKSIAQHSIGYHPNGKIGQVGDFQLLYNSLTGLIREIKGKKKNTPLSIFWESQSLFREVYYETRSRK